MARALEPQAVLLRLVRVKPLVGRQQVVRQPPVKQLLTAVSVSLLMLAVPVAVQLMKLWIWQRASMDWYGGLSPVR